MSRALADGTTIPGEAADAVTAQEHRWLDAAEQDAWRPLVRLIQQLPHALDRQLRDEVGISHAYYSMLAMVSEAPDATLSMGELARITGTTPSRLSHAVDVLVKRGWIERVRCDADRRVQYARLTPEGLALLVEVAPRHVSHVREVVFDRLDAGQVAQLTAIANTILDAIDGR